MASKEAVAEVCLICLETKPLKIVSRCTHCFCVDCLHTFLGKNGDDDVFSCPSCKVDCSRPSDGVKGLKDYTGKDTVLEDVEALMEDANKQGSDHVNTVPVHLGEKNEQNIEVYKCTICLHKKQVVQAINLCVECDCLHICKDCTEVHARNEVTQGHVVVLLTAQGEMCKTHPTSALSMYCNYCNTAVCVVCMLLEHGGHKVEKIQDLIDKKLPELKASFEEKQKRLEELEDLEADLCWCKVAAPTVDKSATLIKEVQDHAEERIEKIIEWKDDVIKQINEDYKVIKDIPIGFGTVSKEVKHLQEIVKRAAGLLAESGHNCAYLENVVTVQHDLDSVTEVGDAFKGCEQQIHELHEHNNMFTPNVGKRHYSFGRITKTKKKTNRKVFKKKIYEHTMQVESKDKFIPCVASFGKRFAVAHPAKKGEPSMAIDIYELPGNLKHTIRDKVPPVYDMAGTPDGNLAVVSNGTGAKTCSVKLFDAETGNLMKTTPDIENVKPLSLCVTFKHQYVILGDNSQGQKQVVVVNQNGGVEIKHIIDEKQVKNAKILSCGGKYIFVGAEEAIFLFEIQNTTLLRKRQVVDTGVQSYDFSVTVWDGFFFCYAEDNSNILTVNTWVTNETTEGITWSGESTCILSSDASGADREVNISTSDGHIIVSHGHTIKVLVK